MQAVCRAFRKAGGPRMTARPAFGALVSEQGGLCFDSAAAFHGYLRGLAGKRVKVAVSQERFGRTLRANSRYWVAVVPAMSEWSGYEKDEAHELFKEMFLRVERELPGGRVVEIVRSTAKLSTEEFYEYTERCTRFLAGHGVRVPELGETE